MLPINGLRRLYVTAMEELMGQFYSTGPVYTPRPQLVYINHSLFSFFPLSPLPFLPPLRLSLPIFVAAVPSRFCVSPVPLPLQLQLAP